jgi:murein DD-endopeptidase MepM/ murein hydrolase activator NlpD
VSEAAMLAKESSVLAARIQSAQSSAPYTPHVSSSGLVWPVNGPVVSPFGMRWGRLHTGIDIAVPYGTPIHAAAAGRVIYAGWMGGYGNLVVIDHGRELATAYAHQSSIAAGNGTTVSQGQVIGYVGCTGHCFGPHLHFEVRVNGQPADPMQYL